MLDPINNTIIYFVWVFNRKIIMNIDENRVGIFVWKFNF